MLGSEAGSWSRGTTRLPWALSCQLTGKHGVAGRSGQDQGDGSAPLLGAWMHGMLSTVRPLQGPPALGTHPDFPWRLRREK